jgi:hypothetical protein
MGDFKFDRHVAFPYKGNNPKIKDRVVVIPEGIPALVQQAFQYNCYVEEVYLPDSVKKIHFQAFEHCKSLRVLSFSHNMDELGCNAINGCDALKTIIYRGTIFEFTFLETPGQTPDLEVVYCTDGEIRFGKDREYYIETLYYPGTRAEWEVLHGPDDWRSKRSKKIICADEL